MNEAAGLEAERTKMENAGESPPAKNQDELASDGGTVDKKSQVAALRAEVAQRKAEIASLRSAIVSAKGQSIRSEFGEFVGIIRKEWVTLVACIALGAILTLAAAFLLNVGDQTFKAFIVQQTEQRVQSYLGRLFVSPAVGGVAALLAAVITAAVVFAQLKHTKAKDHAENWWERYEWITERAFPSKAENKDNAISEGFATILLSQLEVEAVSDLQKKACSNFMSLLVRELPDKTEEVPVEAEVPADAEVPVDVAIPPTTTDGPVDVQEQGPGRVSKNASKNSTALALGTLFTEVDRAYEAALEYVEKTEGTTSSSTDAEIYVLKRQIVDALTEEGIKYRKVLGGKDDEISVQYGAAGRLTLVALPRNPKAAEKRISNLRLSGRPVLALSATPLREGFRENVAAMHWRPSMGSGSLIKAISAFSLYMYQNKLVDKGESPRH
ncbi:conserved hypothetical protein [Arthrobacter sp. 9AX]|uniref:hypothetical protein n=1 Tax=Arthrobacter sp. 9AX TaxID=2653131 RepID=UPI0012F1914B|nr:hypothetical protein [Arthrobacter sp. 9AX]VXC21158.1 conserved hypothetical protein [Arthrobacter sp. 9AX]